MIAGGIVIVCIIVSGALMKAMDLRSALLFSFIIATSPTIAINMG